MQKQMRQTDLRDVIKKHRDGIRFHRDQKGDDRCWLDDTLVWKFLHDTPPDSTTLPTYAEGMQACTEFYNNRQSNTADPIPSDAITDPAHWDDDLTQMDDSTLQAELERIQHAIKIHRDITDRPRTLDDDRALYGVLPEKLPADFRLPPEDDFLGGINSCSGCPNFWDSHAQCPAPKHDLHHWGPCTGK